MNWNPFTRHSSGTIVRRRRSCSTFRLALEELEPRRLFSTNVLTYHNDLARTGQNLAETTLTPANVNSDSFGLQVTYPVDGQIYAEPLYVAGVDVPSQGVHNLVFVATEHDSVYAFDANGMNAPNPIWHVSFINPAAGVNVVLSSDVGCGQISPELGVTGTPVIDLSTNTLYVEAMTKETSGISTTYHQRLHALDLATGAEKFGGPVDIQASVPGTGDGGSTVNFIPKNYKERNGLVLLNGVVYTSWASHCDITPAHGWVIGYDAQTLQQTSVFCTSPNGQLDTIWGGSGSLAVDADGNIYFETGNGSYNASLGNYSESFLKLSTADGGLSVADYFTPFNYQALDSVDRDLGSGAPIVLPDQPGDHPHLMVGSGKEGKIYLIDRDNLGQLNNPPTGPDNIVQELPANTLVGGSWDTPAYFDAGSDGNRWIYYAGNGDRLKAFRLTNGLLSTSPSSQSAVSFTGSYGATPIVSANGTSDGIVWALKQGNPAVLYAYDALDLATELYDSTQAGTRDRLGPSVKFATPTVADGKVFVPTSNSLSIFGLFQVAGPSVTSSTPTGDTFGTVSSVRVTFNEPIAVSTFGLDQVAEFTRTVGATSTDLRGALRAVTAVAGSNNRSFDITFDPQSTLGDYRLVIGPDIRDLAGNPMDQDGNGIPGEIPGDQYTVQFALQGPRVIASTPSDINHLPSELINHVRLTFNEAIVPSTLNTGDVFVSGPNGAIAINSITAVAGSNNTQFDINFATQTNTGTYEVSVFPFVMDAAGHQLDQNQNFIDGELPDDIYAGQFGITGPQVVSAVANSNVAGEVFRLRVTFNEDMDVSSFTTSKIASFTDPSGQDILGSVITVVQASPTNFRQFDVLFAPQAKAGTYTMVIGPHIRDVYGNEMDQDADAALPVETLADAYTATFTVAGPTVLNASPSGTVEPVVDHVRLTFSERMDPSTFSADQVSLTGPDGSAIAVISVAAVPFTNNTQFDITFAPQTVAGGYTLVLDGVADVYGNPLGTYTTQFTIAAFRVVSISPSGTIPRNTDHVRLTFDRPVDTSTFGVDQVSLTGPGGAVTVTGVAAVAGSNNTQFDVSFTPLAAIGTYTLTLSTAISDLYGNSLAAFTATLTVASASIVTNGGFETGDFTGWTQSGDTSFTSVITGTPDGTTIHSGTHAARIGPSGPGLGFLTQTLATTVGVTYTLSFWLSHPYSDTGSGAEWLVRVGGNTLMDVHDPGNFGYTQFTFTFTATSSSTVLQFGFVEPPDYFYLDDVIVTAIG